MPQLRSGVRRGRKPIAAIEPEENNNVNDNRRVTRRTTVARTTRQRGAAGNRVGGRKKKNTDNEEKEVVPVADEKAVRRTASGEVDKGKKEVEKKEEVGEKQMDEYDSAGQSGDKGLAAEDEGSTAPLPERVS